MLLEHTIVMRKHPDQKAQLHVYFQWRQDEDVYREGMFLSRKNWDEMGRPEVITVKVEIGDKLQEAEDHQRNLLDKIPSRLPNAQLHIGPPATLET